jgi:hypothetical protein
LEFALQAQRNVDLVAVSESFESAYDHDDKLMFANEIILPQLYKKGKQQQLEFKDMGQGKDDSNEEACFYACISQVLFGHVQYYYELKVLVSHVFALLSRLHDDHLLWSNETWSYSVIGAAEDAEFGSRFNNIPEEDQIQRPHYGTSTMFVN